MQIALVNRSKRLDPVSFAFQVAAVDKQMREHVCPAWQLAHWPVIAFETEPDPALAHDMTVLDDIGTPGALGWHDDQAGLIDGRVMAPADPLDATTLSHECAEMRIDPTCDQWRQMPDGRSTALEACDAVEADSYGITVELNGETRTIQVSNFLLPNWFSEPQHPADLRADFDYLGRLTAPFTMTSGGYLLVMASDGTQSEVFADEAGRTTLARKRGVPSSRVARRLAKQWLPK